MVRRDWNMECDLQYKLLACGLADCKRFVTLKSEAHVCYVAVKEPEYSHTKPYDKWKIHRRPDLKKKILFS
jgi:hypothetical protein